ncbi:MAG: ABC transporter ATP-binding protein [Patescibacteria group bacterium]
MITLNGIYKIYGDTGNEVTALDNINLEIEKGEYISIMGASGSGKSSLMHIMGLLDKPTKGEYILDGVNTQDIKEKELSTVRNKYIGFVFQAFNLLPRTTVIENVILPLIYRGENRDTAEKKAMETLKKLGIDKRAYFKTNQISGGQQQRVAIARALTQDPTLILADEPTGNVDSQTTQEIVKIFQDLNDEGHSIVIVTHEEDIGDRAKRRIKLKDGFLIEDKIINQHRI